MIDGYLSVYIKTDKFESLIYIEYGNEDICEDFLIARGLKYWNGNGCIKDKKLLDELKVNQNKLDDFMRELYKCEVGNFYIEKIDLFTGEFNFVGVGELIIPKIPNIKELLKL